VDDIDIWLRPVKGLPGFPSQADIGHGEHVRHMRNVHDVRVFGRVFDALRAGLRCAEQGDVPGALEHLQDANEELGNFVVKSRPMPAFRKTLDSTAALIDSVKLGARAAESLAERTGCAVTTFEVAVELALSLCVDEALAVNAGEWAVRVAIRKVD
jgi:hypothetical protein